MITSREPACRSCNLDPTNRLTGELAALEAGTVSQAYVDELACRSAEATVREEHLAEVGRRQAADRQHPESRRPWRDAMRDIRASRE